MQEIDQLVELMARLRDPENGCPWDIEQTFASIAPYTVEEAYEVADAIAREDVRALEDELGDLLLQVVFHAQMAQEQNAFDFAAIAKAITAKLIRRHPHIFGATDYRNAAEQSAAWEAIKAGERGTHASALEGIPRALPALLRAYKLQARAARVGFDWPSPEPVWDKVEEELAELRAAQRAGDAQQLFEELGDLLFACVNLARHLGIDPETALRQGNRKFEQRFRAVEAQALAAGSRPENLSLEELDALWERAKAEASI